jgi:hypothetical protein
MAHVLGVNVVRSRHTGLVHPPATRIAPATKARTRGSVVLDTVVVVGELVVSKMIHHALIVHPVYACV